MYNYNFTSKSIVILIIFSSLLLVSLMGCKESKNETAEHILFFRKESAMDLSESDFFGNKTIIPLESNEYSLIHANPCVKKEGDYLFIYSRDRAYPILRFDMNGSFINLIGSRGNGPNEFTVIYDVIINKEKTAIELLTDNKIIHFSYDGVPIKSENFNIPAFSFTNANGYYWFYTGYNNVYSKYKIFQTDLDFKIINRYLSEKSNMLPIMEYNFRQSPYNTFRETFSNNIYQIKKDSLHLLYTIQFPGMQFPSEIHDIPPMEVIPYLQRIHYASIMSYLENDNYIYIFVSENEPNTTRVFYHWIINKNINYQEIIIRTEMINDSYLMSPQLLTDDDFIYFLGYPVENNNIDVDYDLNPSIVIINLSDIVK